MSKRLSRKNISDHIKLRLNPLLVQHPDSPYLNEVKTLLAQVHAQWGGNDTITPEFTLFYELYPRKVCKKNAIKAWNKIDSSLHDAIMSALREQLPAMLAGEKCYIPHPATWLNGGRWDDEVDAKEVKGESNDMAKERLLKKRGLL